MRLGGEQLPWGEGFPRVAVVLVGGLGTRLRPLTYETPKQLIPLAGQVALYHVFDLVPRHVERIVLACGYKADQIAAYLRDHPYPVPVTVVPEATPLGTGGGMRNVAAEVSDPFLLLNGDVMTGLEIEGLVLQHRMKRALGTMSLFEVKDTRPYGVVALDGADRILRFVEKPEPAEAPSHWINAGVSVWAREVLERIPPGQVVSFEKEILPSLLDAEGRKGERDVYGFPFRQWWEDAGTPERVLNAQQLLFDHPGRRRSLWAVPTGSFVRGPVSEGRQCELGARSLGPYVTLGDRVVLEPDSSVANSILMDEVRVGRGAQVENSILGPGAHIPPGAQVSGEVRVR